MDVLKVSGMDSTPYAAIRRTGGFKLKQMEKGEDTPLLERPGYWRRGSPAGYNKGTFSSSLKLFFLGVLVAVAIGALLAMGIILIFEGMATKPLKSSKGAVDGTSQGCKWTDQGYDCEGRSMSKGFQRWWPGRFLMAKDTDAEAEAAPVEKTTKKRGKAKGKSAVPPEKQGANAAGAPTDGEGSGLGGVWDRITAWFHETFAGSDDEAAEPKPPSQPKQAKGPSKAVEGNAAGGSEKAPSKGRASKWRGAEAEAEADAEEDDADLEDERVLYEDALEDEDVEGVEVAGAGGAVGEVWERQRRLASSVPRVGLVELADDEFQGSDDEEDDASEWDAEESAYYEV